MAEPFLSEIRLMSFVFPPKGWALCNGQLLPINQNQALFSLLGTTFGGDGRTNFALPDLRGRVPAHVGPAITAGMQLGAESVTLTESHLPSHSHVSKVGDSLASSSSPVGAIAARKGRLGHDLYGAPGNLTTLSTTAGGAVGGGQAHSNMQPTLTLSFCIALQGIFPSPT
ncbi:phage tail protein [Massilia sp. Root351]|jgi:microcystin-dependent protein|uniref:phage tail protein n=1 Tax=Massilia sp. Root351 TaxID=1736522 RepID=UPI0007096847|nr:tail fiber protein [Massilia sp. Root351]KQV86283.1 phage tail protein [Massilia sp. Root351]